MKKIVISLFMALIIVISITITSVTAQDYRTRCKAPAFKHGDIRRIAPCGADCVARMRWFFIAPLGAIFVEN